MMQPLNPQLLTLLISLVAYSCFFSGIVIFFKRRDGLAFHFLALNFLAGAWAFGVANLVMPLAEREQIHFWGSISRVCFFFVAPVWFHFVSIYTGQLRDNKWRVVTAYLFTGSLLALFPEGVEISYRAFSGFSYTPVPGPVHRAMTVFFCAVMTDAFWELGRYIKNEKAPLKKEDARYFFFAQAYGYGLMLASLLPVYGIEFPHYHFLFFPFWQFSLVYAAIRYDLLNSEALAKTMHRDRLAALATVTASMQHELKNPLTAIKTFAEYLPKKYDDPEFRKKFTEIVSQEVGRVNELLRQLLEFSRAQEPEREMIDVGQLLGETADFLAPSCEAGAIEVERKIETSLEILADRNQLRQVFLNLIINSIQAMPKGGRLRLQAYRSVGKEICILIGDTGIGIASGDLKKIGDPFFTTKDQGTGLGISIVRNILDKHDAQLTIESREGKGTTVQIKIKPSS